LNVRRRALELLQKVSGCSCVFWPAIRGFKAAVPAKDAAARHALSSDNAALERFVSALEGHIRTIREWLK
jgi:hypothetical protein